MIKNYIKTQIRKTGTYRVVELDKKNLERDKVKLKKKVAELNKKTAQQDVKIGNLNDRVMELKKAKKIKIKENQKLKKTQETLKTQNEKLKKTQETLKTQNEKLKTATVTLQDRMNKRDTLINNLKLENRRVKLERENLKKEVVDLKKVKADLNQQVAQLKDKIENRNKEVVKLKKVHETLRKQDEKLKKNQEILKRKSDKLKTNIDTLLMRVKYRDILIENLKSETRSVKEIYLEKDTSYLPDYDKFTVIIPYRKTDDPEREENLDMIMKYLSSVGIRNLIISEHSDVSSRRRLVDDYKNSFNSFKYIFSDAHGEKFNKSHAINRAVMESETAYIALFDMDSLTRKKNIDMALYLLDKGFEVVHAFNRIIKDVKNKKEFMKDYDFKLIDSPAQYRDSADGGIVFWNKESFIDIGMKNEYFRGWGNEDNEILIRANLWGLKQIRIDDTLYHLYHHRPKIRSKNNADQMNKMIQIKNKEDMLVEISKWPWYVEAKKS